MRAHPIVYSLGNLGTNIFAQAFATFALFFYVDHLRAALGPITFALGVQSVWHAVLNPLIGVLSDRSRTRWGRRLPYIAGGTIPLGLVFFLLWHPFVSQNALVAYFFILVVLFDALYLMVVINWTSLFPELFTTLEDRAYAARWRQFVGILGLMIGVALPPLLYGHWGWTIMGAILAVIGTGGFLAVLGSHRPVQTITSQKPTPWLPLVRESLRQPGFIRYLTANFLIQFVLLLIPGVMPFYGKYVLHLHHSQLTLLLAATFITALLMLYPWSWMIRRVGTQKSFRLAMILLGIAVIPFGFIHHFVGGILTMVGIGIGLGGFLTLVDIVMAELIDDHARRHPEVRKEGTFYGINGFVLRLGTTLEAAVIYGVLHITGYHPNSAGLASASVLWGLRWLMGGVPLLAILLAILAFRRFGIPESPRHVMAPLTPEHNG